MDDKLRYFIVHMGNQLMGIHPRTLTSQQVHLDSCYRDSGYNQTVWNHPPFDGFIVRLSDEGTLHRIDTGEPVDVVGTGWTAEAWQHFVERYLVS